MVMKPLPSNQCRLSGSVILSAPPADTEGDKWTDAADLYSDLDRFMYLSLDLDL